MIATEPQPAPPAMLPATPPAPAPAVRPPGTLTVGLLCLAAALLSLAVSRQTGSVATLWYANAVAVACLAVRPASGWGGPVVALSIAIVGANVAWGDDPWVAASFVPANLVEVLLGALGVRAMRLHERGLRSPAALGLLLLTGGVLPQFVGATLGAATLAWHGLGRFDEIWPAWYAGSVIGALSVLPLAFLACRAGGRAAWKELADARLLPLLALSLGVAILAMSQLPYPFVITLLPLLLAAVLLEQVALEALALAVSVAMGLCLALGLLVPPPAATAWQQSLLFLAFAATLLPAHLLGAAMCALRDSRVRAERAHEELRRAHDALDQFVRIASHDLREPLNTVAQFGALVVQDEGPRLSPEGRRYLDLMTGAARRMRSLLDDCLTYVRVKNEQLQPQPVDLEGLLAELRQALAGRLRETGAELLAGPLPAVQGHPALLSLLFQNLLSNALKFVPPDRRPRVQVSARVVGDHVQVAVADNGIGIAAEDLQRLFQPFQRLHTRRRFEGNGLGLSLARDIAERHGGRIEVASVPGEGSTFTVELPLARR